MNQFKLKVKRLKGVCLVEHCDNPAPTSSNGKWCNFHSAEIRKAQVNASSVKHRESVKRNKPIGRHLAYAGVATRWTLEHPDEAFAIVLRGESNYDVIGLAAAMVKAAGVPIDQLPVEVDEVAEAEAENASFMCEKCGTPRTLRNLIRTSRGYVCRTVEVCELLAQGRKVLEREDVTSGGPGKTSQASR